MWIGLGSTQRYSVSAKSRFAGGIRKVERGNAEVRFPREARRVQLGRLDERQSRRPDQPRSKGEVPHDFQLDKGQPSKSRTLGSSLRRVFEAVPS